MVMRRRKSQARPTAAQCVYEAARDAISTGRFKIGERLTEGHLAEEFEVSRTPVREALKRLASDGFVVFTPHAGALVKGWSAREVRDVFEIRANLEGMASGLAAARAGKDDVDRLEELRRTWQAAVETTPRDVPRISEANRALHAEILALSGNKRLESMCLQLMDLGFLTRSFSTFSEDGIRSSSNDHAMLVKAIGVGDAQWAEALMRAHILAAASIFTGTDAQDGNGPHAVTEIWPEAATKG